MRQLATIQKIEDIHPIEGKDRIVHAKILEWGVVVESTMKPGDLVVYCEIDSVFPEKPEFEFLRKNKFRIKTIKLGGYLSQGICFPLSILGEGWEKYSIGDDVTEVIGITKYEIPENIGASNSSRGNFPAFIPKTDETRVQSIKSILEEYEGTDCYIAEKLDGSSLTAFIKDGDFGVCSRNLEVEREERNVFWRTAIQYELQTKIRELGNNVAFQGELLGPSIQGNKYKLRHFKFYLFNIYDIDNKKYYDYAQLIETAKRLEIETVPILNNSFSLTSDVAVLLNLADAKSQLNSDTNQEGIVIRPKKELYHRKLGRVSFKAISNTFLLNNKE